jgi:hypothetical protein
MPRRSTLLIQPFIGVADAVIRPGETGVQQVMGANGTGFAHGLIQAFRRASAADHREVFDKAFERFGHTFGRG